MKLSATLCSICAWFGLMGVALTMYKLLGYVAMPWVPIWAPFFILFVAALVAVMVEDRQ